LATDVRSPEEFAHTTPPVRVFRVVPVDENVARVVLGVLITSVPAVSVIVPEQVLDIVGAVSAILPLVPLVVLVMTFAVLVIVPVVPVVVLKEDAV